MTGVLGKARLLWGLMAGILIMAMGGCGDSRTEPSYAPLRHPFRGAKLFLDADSLAADWQRANGAAWLDPIVGTPQARWLTGPTDLDDLRAVLNAARDQDALLVLVAYYVPNLDCAGPEDGAPNAGAYGSWIDQVIEHLGATKTVLILEPDAIAADCFDEERAALLADASQKLAGAGHYVYVDAGHPRWRTAAETAERLRKSGIQHVEGFSVNVSNRQSTADSQRWSAELSKLVGNREGIIDTSRNGLPAPPDDEWCNSARQGLGERPKSDPGLERIAALLWVKRPGESDGPCGADPGAGVGSFSPRQARSLIVNAPWVSADSRRLAEQARPPAS
ncbi:MAG TPA: glycoside hydrolase family 6 protein [Jiangellales bacterium]|nr:glycoside hydrolase family 6 protein [Jiangellales bacterium]